MQMATKKTGEGGAFRLCRVWHPTSENPDAGCPGFVSGLLFDFFVKAGTESELDQGLLLHVVRLS